MKKVFAFLAAVLLLAAACKKSSHESPEQTGLVRWGGPPEVDGLGYYIKMDSSGKIYHPKELADWFKHDSLHVAIRFTETGQNYGEDFQAVGVGIIDIKSIRTL
jgi:hypothetical protein